MNRRSALGTLAAMGAAATSQTMLNGMLYRTLGNTGEKVSAIGLGGYHLGHPPDPADAIRIIRRAIGHGITFMDNCWDYHGGESERRMGIGLRDGFRQKVFLMTKFDGRTKDATARQINESLQRLQTDHIDLIQYHENIRLEDPDRFFAVKGPLEAGPTARSSPRYTSQDCRRSSGPPRKTGYRNKSRLLSTISGSSHAQGSRTGSGSGRTVWTLDARHRSGRGNKRQRSRVRD